MCGIGVHPTGQQVNGGKMEADKQNSFV